ncbi:hypothetical protein [Actinoplanes sp. NPDC051494]|uniref:hypothetical protein n=1 Tax=Actinoplanes sp. NPDC051494 TaxID=3363907 RepID=UPI0037B465E7
MFRTYRVAMAAACTAALTACAGPAPVAAPTPAPAPSSVSPAPEPSATSSPAPPRTPTAAPATSGPKLVAADVSTLKNYEIGIGVPVEISSSLDAGKGYLLTSHPDGTVDFAGTKGSESARMIMKAAKVRKRTEDTRNTVVVMAAPAAGGSGADQCVTDTRKGVLRMRDCVPGDKEQAWVLAPEGDFGNFVLRGAHTETWVDEGKIADEGWPVFTTELAP